ncbi:hypothetical protein ACIPW5_38575 [Streptomyces sp. NPDC090077]|uniref:hypothetical protein n=1 Tax=Streptomyces sp. NPDC090077 TaxID=3365938 RepID=UPI0037F9F24F
MAVERWSARQIDEHTREQRERWAREEREREARQREEDRVDALDPVDFLESRLAQGRVRSIARRPAQPLDSDLLEAMEVRPCVVCGADAGEACGPVAGTPRRSGLTHLARLRKLGPGEDSLTAIRARVEEARQVEEEYEVWALGERCWCGAEPGAVCRLVSGAKRVGAVHRDRLLGPGSRFE